MEREKWPQPNWFWWVIGLYLALEYGALLTLVLLGSSPIEILNLSHVLIFVFPLFFIITFLFLPNKLGFDGNTIFYLFTPFLLYMPNWVLLSEYFNELF